jgi:hypothetical protein
MKLLSFFNNNSGTLAFFLFFVTISIFGVRLDFNVVATQKEIQRNNEFHLAEIESLRSISMTLMEIVKRSDEDRVETRGRQEKINETINQMIRSIDRLNVILEQMNGRGSTPKSIASSR